MSEDDGHDEHHNDPGKIEENQPEFPMNHGSINDYGGELLAEDYLTMFSQTTTIGDVFKKPSTLFQRSQSRHQNTGKWIAETATIEETFKDGPICLDTISKINATSNQHNFLVDCATFFKRKYPDNWIEPMQWVNVNVLRPPGNPDKLTEIIKTVKDKQYFPRCQEEPMASFCHSKACRLQKYGVGEGNAGAGQDMALTVIDTVPAIYFVGEDDNRMKLSSDELTNLTKYRNKCLDHQRDFPVNVTAKDWILLIHTLIKDAVKVQPSVLHRKNVKELEALERYFSSHVPRWVRSRGEEYLNGKVCDDVRIRIKDERIYFKWSKLMRWLEKAEGMRQQGLDNMRAFIDTEATYYSKEQKRDWFRCSHSLMFSVFDEDVIYQWLHPDAPEETE